MKEKIIFRQYWHFHVGRLVLPLIQILLISILAVSWYETKKRALQNELGWSFCISFVRGPLFVRNSAQSVEKRAEGKDRMQFRDVGRGLQAIDHLLFASGYGEACKFNHVAEISDSVREK